MNTPEDASRKTSRGLLARIGGGLFALLSGFVRFLFVAWASLAIYYSTLPWLWLRVALAVGFLVFAVWALWRPFRRRRVWAFVAVYLVILVGWSTIRPSHDREWRREVAVMPRAEIDGDRLRFSGFRNFEYRSADDFTEIYEEREFDLSHLTSLDFYVSYWQVGPVGHTFLSFNFDNAQPLCISIETRPEKGEGFDPIASLFKQFELIYVVGDERDIVGVRTQHRNEDVFLYRIRIPPAIARELLRVYVRRINELADQPEFYHLLSNSCTINIVRYANAVGRVGRLSLNHILNGFIDHYLYSAGMLETDLPFEEFRRQSHINAAANEAYGKPDFASRIRNAIRIPKY
ncbi:DUF4105 domain-containing protein [bacterium]|nr:DUF4105 domain-containing protein [bacterium]